VKTVNPTSIDISEIEENNAVICVPEFQLYSISRYLVVGDGAHEDPLLVQRVPPALLLVLRAHEVPVAGLLQYRYHLHIGFFSGQTRSQKIRFYFLKTYQTPFFMNSKESFINSKSTVSFFKI
jgi:hypothetical protein